LAMTVSPTRPRSPASSALLVEGAIVLAYIHHKPDPVTDAREATILQVFSTTNR
jgi:hypothetical protein